MTNPTHPLADIGGTPIDALERALNQIDNKYPEGAKVNIQYALDTLRTYIAQNPITKIED